jgi:hypothetical protein
VAAAAALGLMLVVPTRLLLPAAPLVGLAVRAVRAVRADRRSLADKPQRVLTVRPAKAAAEAVVVVAVGVAVE